ncbi:Aste57867_20460 [Aphanomyces stellatus]|uniref:Aste57867_20460 protein n=1 Tax=Aphanomyces stellatus TaxID=120398 RepID=A0A485LFR3_9STRA|nr:hypothetical protein As57867_020394 [Aphanomyces stellatus]VFT97146.1 Aste57867_20460 [Aphanomyces stellatus]
MAGQEDIEWICVPLTDMSVTMLYDVLQLRSRVFVVEQACLWHEIDGLDKQCHHLVGLRPSARGDKYVVGYARLIPALTNGGHQVRPIISRVVVPPECRGSGLGRALFQRAIAACKALWPTMDIEIRAQQRLEPFYMSMGFQTISDMYEKDGIQHVDMIHP